MEEIKSRVNIADVVGQYVKLERAGRSQRARCPFHKEKTPSFFVSPERGTYICFGCGEKGDIFSFVQKIEGVEFKEALQELATRAGVVLKKMTPKSPQEVDARERLFQVCEAATVFFVEQLQTHHEVLVYLRSRALTDETIAAWRLGYAPARWDALHSYLKTAGFTDDEMIAAGLAIRTEKSATSGESRVYDRFRGRVMFPISDTGGRVIAYSGRFFEEMPGGTKEEPAKYVNSPETDLFKKSRVLYGLDKAKQAIRKADCILLVEGQFDLVLSHQSGLPFAVALSGTALTPEHLSLLGRLSKRLVLALDADEAGLRSGLKSAREALAVGFDVKIPTFVGGKDPADIAKEDPEALRAAIRSSQTAVEFFLQALRPGAKDERAYKKAVEAQVVPLVAALTSKIDQAHFTTLVASKLHVPESAVAAEVAKATQSGSSTTFRESTDANEAVPLPAETLSPHERAGAMILFHSAAGSAPVLKVKEFLGNERVAALSTRLQEDAESFRFSFDALGDNEEHTINMLLQTIERGVIEEELQRLQSQVREGAGDQTTLLVRLATLKRRQEELRN